MADGPPLKSQYLLDVHGWRVIDRESGPVNYYKVVEDPSMPYIHSAYEPPMETTVLGFKAPDEVLQAVTKLRWTWRAVTLPRDANECGGRGDSAATVYVTWKRGLRYYAIKYVWSTQAPKGAICSKKRNPFVAQDMVIQETGGPVGVWKTEEIDLKAEFRKHFENGDPTAEVPDFQGVGIMTDGDQTESPASADFAAFTLIR